MKITQAVLGTLKPGRSPYDLPDSEQRGLVLRVRPSGHHSWLVRLGRAKWYTLGRCDVIPPLKARKLAQEKLGEQAAGGDPIAAKRTAKKQAATLGDFVKGHYRAWASAHLKSTKDAGTRVEQTFPDLLDKRLGEITAFSVERWRTQRHKAGITASTTNRDLDSLRSVLSKAVEWGLLVEHPLRKVRRAKLDTRGRVRFLSDTEEARLRAALQARERRLQAGRDSFNQWRAERGYRVLPPYPTYADHLQPLVLLALLTGARRGELFDLRWGAVDLVADRVTFAGTTTKSGLSRRVPLCDEAHAVLRAWHDQQAPKDRAPDALVFPSPQTGRRLDNIATAWARLMKASGVAGFRFHDLRHTFASQLAQRGVDLYVIQRLLGHASPVMTQRYSHLTDADLAAAVSKLAQA